MSAEKIVSNIDFDSQARDFWLKHHREVVRPKYHPESTECMACAGMTDIGETMFAADFAKHLLADSILITREQLEGLIGLLPKLVPSRQPHDGEHKFDNWHEDPGDHDYATCSICDRQSEELLKQRDELLAVIKTLI